MPQPMTIMQQQVQQLLEAAQNGDLSLVEQPLRNGADVNTTDWMGNDTPLHVACKKGHLDIVRTCSLLHVMGRLRSTMQSTEGRTLLCTT